MTCKLPIEWYTDELVFLKKNYFNLTNSELNEAINARRQEPVALSTMLNQCQRMGLKRGIQIRWSPEDIAYLKRYYETMGDKELAIKLSRRKKTFRIIDGKRVYRKFTKKNIEKKRELLGLKRTEKQVLAVRKRNIKLGLTFAFSKEKHAWNSGMRPVAKEGDIRIWKNQDGNYKRQIKIDGRFIPYTRWFYINNIGPLKPDEIVFHIDFDSLNDEPENLEVRNVKYKVTRISDCYRALPLIQARIDKHISAAPRMNYMQPAEKLEYHKTLIYLKGIEKKITNRINKHEMKLKVYDSTTQSSRYSSPCVRITKGGVIYVNVPALELLNLKENDTISFANDEDQPKDWYVFRDAKGMKLSKKSGSKDKTASLGIANSALCRNIRNTLKLEDDKNYSFRLAGEPTTDNGHNMWALLTSNVK